MNNENDQRLEEIVLKDRVGSVGGLNKERLQEFVQVGRPALPFLLRLVSTPSFSASFVQRWNWGPRGAPAPVKDQLKLDLPRSLRIEAVVAIVMIGDEGAKPTILEAIRVERDSAIRTLMNHALEALNDSSKVESIVNSLF